MRLGANDYIQKEKFGEEFESWVNAFYSRPFALKELPSLIGYLHQAYLAESVPFIQARRLIDLFEATVRLLTSIILSEHASALKSLPEDYVRLRGLQRPTLGVHVSVLFEYLKQNDGRLVRSFDLKGLTDLRREFDALTAIRNSQFGHSSTLSSKQSSDVIDLNYPRVVRIINGISTLRSLELISVDGLGFDGQVYTLSGKLLKGENLHPQTAKRLSRTPAATDHVVLYDGSTVVQDLHPFVRIELNRSENLYVYSLFDQLTERGWKSWTVPTNM